MPTSRQNILDQIRQHSLGPTDLPSLDGEWITYADPRRQFAEVLESVGGRCVVVEDASRIHRELQQLPAFQQARKIVSLVPAVAVSTVDFDGIDDPHTLDDVDFAIAAGQFAVAENAAVWVTGEGVKHRAIYFIAQHLALVVPATQIVDNLHQAYERLTFPTAGFGVFISGPSKTADIEQSLVIGAHGARSLTVFLVEHA